MFCKGKLGEKCCVFPLDFFGIKKPYPLIYTHLTCRYKFLKSMQDLNKAQMKELYKLENMKKERILENLMKTWKK